MASGDRLYVVRNVAHYRLLDAIAAADNGVWVDATVYSGGSIHLVATGGTVSLTVQVRSSSAPTMPANTEHGAQIGSDVVFSAAGQQHVALDNCPRWLKLRVSAHTTGTIDGYGILRTA